MSFLQALEDRNKQHFAYGGISFPKASVGLPQAANTFGSALGSVANQMGSVGTASQLPGLPQIPGVGKSLGGLNPLTHNPLTQKLDQINQQAKNLDTFKPNMPTNNFQASAPAINQTDFSGQTTLGQNAFNAGQGNLGNTFANQLSLANSAGGTLGAQQGLYGQQQNLANALQAQSMGQGPNPAQLQFQQNMDQAMQQQAGALASQRGINPALAAHMAQQQGAAMGQGAAGQAAQLQAQQQLAAQGQLGQQQSAMGQNLLGQNSTLANQGNLYGQAAGTAGTQASLGSQYYGQNVGANQAQNVLLSNNALGAQGINAGVAGQNADIGVKGQQIQADVAKTNADTYAKILGGVMNGAGSAAASAIAAAHGAVVPGQAKEPGDSPENDTVDAKLSPGEIVVPRSAAKSPESAMEFIKAIKKWKGGEEGSTYGKVLGHKKEIAELKKKLAELEKRVG